MSSAPLTADSRLGKKSDRRKETILHTAMMRAGILWFITKSSLSCDLAEKPVVARGTCGLWPMAYHDGTMCAVSGKNAQPGAWPRIISIQDPWRRGKRHVCRGSLISPQWVLIAAHCFIKARHITMWHVMVGATQLTHLGPEAQVHNIKRLLVHEHYSSISESNNIVLLRLDQPVQCRDSVQLTCVPDALLRVSELTTCYVSGWGATTARFAGTTDVLQEAKVHLIDLNLCNSSQWYGGAIQSHSLCIGYPQGKLLWDSIGDGGKSAKGVSSYSTLWKQIREMLQELSRERAAVVSAFAAIRVASNSDNPPLMPVPLAAPVALGQRKNPFTSPIAPPKSRRAAEA
ncbi:acrosin-like [Athene noctua]|uniref:acrosin-like n=1 Tax=Athene noctua TaxID=126797 RepID=UPI003EB72A4E